MIERQLSLNTPIKVLQQNLWEIKKESAQIEMQNNKLKGKLNSQMKWRKRRCQSNFGNTNPYESNELAMKLTQMKERNKSLKERIADQEEQLKEMQNSIHQFPKLLKRKVKLERWLKKYSRKIQVLKQNKKEKEEEQEDEEDRGMIKQKFVQAESQIEELKKEAIRTVQQLKILRKENKKVNEEVIGLINVKNQLKRNLKQIRNRK